MWKKKDTAEEKQAQGMLPKLDVACRMFISSYTVGLTIFSGMKRIETEVQGTEVESRKRLRSKDLKPLSDSVARKERKIESVEHGVEESVCLMSSLCLDLWEALFDSHWTKRHGAAMGLRNLTASWKSKRSPSQGYSIWLEDCLIRCLCVLALDQYADFSSEYAVAPVRQLCAQVYGQISSLLPSQDIQLSCLQAVLDLTRHSDWHCCYGGLLGIRYVLPIASSDFKATLWEPMVEFLSSSNDDIQLAALIILLESTDPQMVHIVRPQCVLAIQSIFRKQSENSEILSKAVAFVKLLCCQSQPDENIEQTWIETLPFIVPQLSHVSELVRCATIDALSALLGFLNPTKLEDFDLLYHILMRLRAEDDAVVAYKLIKLWKWTILKLPPPSIDRFVPLVFPKQIAAFLGYDCVSTTIAPGFVVSERVLSSLDSIVGHNSTMADNVIEMTEKWLSSNSATAQYAAGYFLRQSGVSQSDQIQKHFKALLFRILFEQPDQSEWFTEHDVLWQRLMQLQNNLEKEFREAKIRIPKRETMSKSRESFERVAQNVSRLPYVKLKGGTFEAAGVTRQILFEVHEKFCLEYQLFSVRIRAQIAASFIELYPDLPQKINPLVQALMESLKGETNIEIQRSTAESVAKFIRVYGKQRSKCVNKMIHNMSNSICAIECPEDIDTVEKEIQVRIRGAELCVAATVGELGRDVFDILPELLHLLGMTSKEALESSSILRISRLYQIVLPNMHLDAMGTCVDQMQQLCQWTRDYPSDERLIKSVATTISCMCRLADRVAFEQLYEHLLVHLETQDSSQNLAIQVLIYIVESLEGRIVPYVPSLIRYAMIGMNADEEKTRRSSARVFSLLVPLISVVLDTSSKGCDIIDRANNVSLVFLSRLLLGEAIQHQPVHESIELRQYQQHGVDWLNFLAQNRLNGILADDMGLGKTLQALCAFSLGDSSVLSLVVCPSTLVEHWISETNKFFHGRLSCMRGIECLETLSSISADFIIMSYPQVRKHATVLTSYRWRYVVLDEGHLIRNPSTQLSKAIRQLRSQHRLILSGTPIQNNVRDIWCLFDFLMPGYLQTYDVFRKTVELPILKSRHVNANKKQREAGAMVLSELHKKVLPFIIRRTKEQVLTELPPKIITDIQSDLSDLQLNLYQAIQQMGKGALETLMLLRKVCMHPRLITSCKSVVEIGSKRIVLPSDLKSCKYSGKLTALESLLTDCLYEDRDQVVGHRCLIFAQLQESLSLIEQMLEEKLKHITYRRMDGKTPSKRRFEIASEFNADPSIDILLLTTNIGGLGLNLTGADTVIFVEHSWNPFVDLQAMDRAHRLGQTRTVQVFRLVAAKTIDERIMNLQTFKTHVAEKVVQSTAPDQQVNVDQVLRLLETSIGTIQHEEENTTSLLQMVTKLGDLWDESQYESLELS